MDKRPVHKISPLRRLLCAPVVSLCFLAGLGPFLDPGSFTSPLFEPIRDLAPLTYWGATWLAAGALALFGGLHGSWEAYTAANVIVAGLSTLWLGALIYARWWLGIDLSWTAIGLWLFPLLSMLIVTAVPAETVDAARRPEDHRHVFDGR